MKKTMTIITLALGIFTVKAQSTVIDFETFTLSPNTAYTNTNSVPFQTSDASFQYQWDASFSYWSGGFSYTNKYDSATAGFGNLYGVKPLKGYNSSNTYVIAQNKSIINLSAPSNTVDGFYITNTTYAYKSMKFGDSFARKFGDTTGTGSGTTIAQGSYPDFFKVTVKGYKNGALLSDSVAFYLADYRNPNNSLDYIVNGWQWVNTSTLGNVDSLKFYMYTSDNGQFGPNTPLFFGIDNVTIFPSTVGLKENQDLMALSVYPNPVINELTISKQTNTIASFEISNINGSILIKDQISEPSKKINLSEFPSGVYFMKISDDRHITTKKIIKN